MEKITKNTLLGMVLAGLVTGCSTSTPKDGLASQDPANLPEAAPSAEPPSRYGNPLSYEVFGTRYYVDGSSEGYQERGIASWYGEDFHGKQTSSGPPYDMYAMTAAHKSLPIPTYVRVTHLENGRSIVVRVNDRGPFVGDRVIDLSYAAAARLDMIDSGTAEVEVVALPPYQYLPGYGPEEPDRLLAANTTIDSSTTPAGMDRQAAAQGFAQASYQVPAAPAHEAVSNRRLAPEEAMVSLFLQVGAFSERGNAERLRSRLTGHLHHQIRIDSSANSLHKVQIGPLSNADEAEQMALQLVALGIDNLRVIAD